MRILELFSGTESISKVFRSRGHECITIDNDDKHFNPDIILDLSRLDVIEQLAHLDDLDMIWASPPCQGFSVAAIGYHWCGGTRAYKPRTRTAKMGIRLVENTLKIVRYFQPKFWFIENPRGVLRKLPFMQEIPRVTITYCQYGDTRMKPTDIWGTVHEANFRPMCKNGDPCHEAAPRGSRTGTQGLKGAIERAVIPEQFCIDLCEQLERL